MGTPQYHTVRPFSADPKGLPRLMMPDAKLNGVIEGRTFQYQPSDNPKSVSYTHLTLPTIYSV